jgi:hypothetical protein
MTTSVRRLALPLLVGALAATVSACASDHLRGRDAQSVRAGQLLDASYTASVRGTRSHVMLPSGRVDLTLGRPVDEVPARANARAVPLRPADGAVAVGVSWSLHRGAYPDSTNRQLTSPRTVFGLPQPVRLWLVTDGTRHEVPHVGTLELPVGRARNTVWVVVPSGARQWRFELQFQGVTQSVDARTGKVSPGAAAALYRPLPGDHYGQCELVQKDSYASCVVDYAVGYPYADGIGWAPPGKVFALLHFYVDGEFDNGDVRVAGTRPLGTVTGLGETFVVHLVSPARTYALRGTSHVKDGRGRTATVPLTGSLTPGGAA